MAKYNFKKEDIIKNLSFSTGFSLNYSKKIVNDLVEILIKNIQSGNFNLKNIGTFKIIYKRERIGRNPKTREEFVITSRKTISFSLSKKISNRLNLIS